MQYVYRNDLKFKRKKFNIRTTICIDFRYIKYRKKEADAGTLNRSTYTHIYRISDDIQHYTNLAHYIENKYCTYSIIN